MRVSMGKVFCGVAATCVLSLSLVACGDRGTDVDSAVIDAPDPSAYDLLVQVPVDLEEQSETVAFSHSVAVSFMGAAALWVQSEYRDQHVEDDLQRFLESGQKINPAFIRPLSDVLDANSKDGLPTLTSQQIISWEPIAVTGQDELTGITWKFCFLLHDAQSLPPVESEACILVDLVPTRDIINGGWIVRSLHNS